MSSDEQVRRRMGGPVTPLAHGRWSLEVRGDEVADVRFDGVLLLRAIRPVVRDQDWNTVPVEVLDRSWPTADGGTFETRLAFAAGEIAYAVTLRVGLTEDELVVDFRGEAGSDFARNRIGLVVLHPADEAGRDVVVRHPDGRRSSGRWPSSISPHQPFTDVAGFAWSRSGVSADLDLAGDVFETEDQRNWTDASFKTYSTPLSRPFPVAVATGETCWQQVLLRAGGRRTGPRPTPPDGVTVHRTVVARVPELALGAALHPAPADLPPVAGYGAVLVELVGHEEEWPGLLAAAGRQAGALDVGLDVRLVTADPDAIRRAVRSLSTLRVRRLAAFDPESHLSTTAVWTMLSEEVGRQRLDAELLGGTRAHFTELNRGRAAVPADVPALTFSLTPTMHAVEIPHLVDSLATQRTVIQDATTLAGGRLVHVGPVTLARRFNAVATTARPDPAEEAARAVDPLQDTDVVGAWTLGSVAALTIPGVASLCYFETAGPRGVRRADGSPTPAGTVLDEIALLRGRPVLAAEAPEGLAVLPVGQGDDVVLLLGNLTAERRGVPVRRAGGAARVVELAPWGCGSVRLEGSG